MRITLRFFASLRERLKKSEECEKFQLARR